MNQVENTYIFLWILAVVAAGMVFGFWGAVLVGIFLALRN